MDLFGTDQNYVIPVQNLQKDGELTEKFIWMQENEAAIREKLQMFMPEYINRAMSSKNHLEALLNSNH